MSLRSLIEVNVSSNQFTGPIPDTLLSLLSSSPSSFMGNPGLCVNCLSTCPSNSVLSPCDHPRSRQRLSKLDIIVISICLSLFVIVVLVGLVCLIKLFGRRDEEDFKISPKDGPASLLNKVMEATENLDERYIIGKGAHGTVFKAALAPDNIYAVKKLVFGGHRGERASMVREIQTVKAVRHRNLVKLEEFWLRKDYGLLLYRYMEMGSLHEILHGGKNPPADLEWSVRYKIALGIAQGLAYLHHDCNPAVVHRDIKPENILLDSEMEPRISDFGIAKLLDQSSTATQPSASSVVGTIGYIAPENAFMTKKTRKSDVYSYGVLLLELLTMKRALDPSFAEGTDIVGWAGSAWKRTGDIRSIVDPYLASEFFDSGTMEQVGDVLSIAFRCVEPDSRKRPGMREVVNQLLDANDQNNSKCS